MINVILQQENLSIDMSKVGGVIPPAPEEDRVSIYHKVDSGCSTIKCSSHERAKEIFSLLSDNML